MKGTKHTIKVFLKVFLIDIKQQKGFTLIELLIVVIIIGMLAGVAMPNYLRQVSKARESSTKLILGTISRAQQAYHWEHREFAEEINQLGIDFNSDYHSFPKALVISNHTVKHKAIVLNPFEDSVRNYALGVYYENGAYGIAICESKNPGGSPVGGTVYVSSKASDPCMNNGTKIK